MNAAALSSRPAVDGLEGHLDRIERLLEARSDDTGDHPVLAALGAAARALGAMSPKLPAPYPDETLESALHRLGERADMLARLVVLDESYLEGGTGPFICHRASDDAVIAVVRNGRGWLVHDAARPGAPVKLDEAACRDLPRRGFQLGLCLPARSLTRWDLLRFGWRNVAPDLASYTLLTTVAGLIASAFPLLAATIIGIVVPGRETRLLIDIVVMLFVLALVNVMVGMASSLALVRIQGKVGSMLRAAAIDRAVRLPANQRLHVPPPIMALAVRAVEGWHRAIWTLVLSLMASVLMAFPSLVVMASTLPGAALAVFAVGVVALGIAYFIARRQQATLMASAAGSPASWMATAYETFFNVDTVRATGAETAMLSRWAAGFASQQSRQLRAARIGAWGLGVEAGIEGLFVLAAIGAVVLFGALMQAETTIPFVMAAGVVVGAASVMLRAIGQLAMLSLQKRLAQPLLTSVPGTEAHGEALMEPRGALSLISVGYRHSAESPPVLVDVSLEVAPGEYVGIVGSSGAGKSTLLNLILGMATAESGAVFIDGVDTRKLDMSAVRRRIGIVGQGACLFPGALRDNVGMGANQSDAAIWESLRLAGVDQDIAAMALGLGTVIGDTNPMLSGGQVQRILFARAIAARPKLIILDEATSALDPAAQAVVTATIRELGISVIAVAHRLETLGACDRIYVLDRGRIVQQGRPEALARAPGKFAELISAQA